MAYLRARYEQADRMRGVSPMHRLENQAALEMFTDRLPFQRPEWQAEAECAGSDIAMFFPGRGEPNKLVDRAKAICAGCAVQAECLEWGMDEHHGIFGGKSENERRKLRRDRAKEKRQEHGHRTSYNRGCRCVECVEANRVYKAKLRKEAS
jgi:WhiB family redox-sensing transcriptional regulator